jgi:hypothetical protein
MKRLTLAEVREFIAECKTGERLLANARGDAIADLPELSPVPALGRREPRAGLPRIAVVLERLLALVADHGRPEVGLEAGLVQRRWSRSLDDVLLLA